MTDDLVKQLRAAGRAFINNQYNLHTRAADRIEELEKSRQHYLDCYTRKTQHELEVRARIEELEAALRKIGEGDVCVSLMTHPAQCGRAYQARTALAGEKKHEP